MTMEPQAIPTPPPPPELPWAAVNKPQAVLSVCQPPPGVTCPRAGDLVSALTETAGRLGVEGLTIGRSRAACEGTCGAGPLVALPERSLFMRDVTPAWVEPLITETLLNNRLLFPLLAIDPLRSIHPRLYYDKKGRALIVMDEEPCMVQVARYFLAFHDGVSCGKCIPCRLGVVRLIELLDEIIVGAAPEDAVQMIRQLTDNMAESAYCHFADKVTGPVLLILKHYQEEFLTHVSERFCPARVCPLHY
jgi:(2Fe-2S) ferredoxin